MACDIIVHAFFLAIPTLILLDERGGVITTEGLTYVFNDPDGEVRDIVHTTV